jgi:hypothetical protein
MAVLASAPKPATDLALCFYDMPDQRKRVQSRRTLTSENYSGSTGMEPAILLSE